MKNDANPASTPTTTTSMAMIPRFIAVASGESFWPKHTGHANAARGTAKIRIIYNHEDTNPRKKEELFSFFFVPSCFRGCVSFPDVEITTASSFSAETLR